MADDKKEEEEEEEAETVPMAPGDYKIHIFI